MSKRAFFNNQDKTIAECLIIMPIYNRKAFMSGAFASLRAQTYSNWRLIIVDDGSSDEPFEEITQHAQEITQEVCYVYQENAGPGSARAKGLTLRRNEQYVAFFDSDDIWLPSYLEIMIEKLKFPLDLDWVFCACRRVILETGEIILNSTHHDENTNQKSAFFQLKMTKIENINLFTDNSELAEYQINHPINAGFQNSVVRATLLEKITIPSYRIGEDRFFLLDAILHNAKVGFIEDVLVVYNVHQQNISDTNKNTNDSRKKIMIQQTLANAYQDYSQKVTNEKFKLLLQNQTRNILFWQVAYNGYLLNNMQLEARKLMREVAFSKPFRLKFIKTYIVNTLFGRLLAGKNK